MYNKNSKNPNKSIKNVEFCRITSNKVIRKNHWNIDVSKQKSAKMADFYSKLLQNAGLDNIITNVNFFYKFINRGKVMWVGKLGY